MFEYGALLNKSLTDQVSESFALLVQFLSEISPLWYVGGVILFIAFARMLNNHRITRK